MDRETERCERMLEFFLRLSLRSASSRAILFEASTCVTNDLPCSHAFVRAHALRRVSGHHIRRRTTTRRCPSARHRADLTLDEHTNLTRGNRSRGLLRRHVA